MHARTGPIFLTPEHALEYAYRHIDRGEVNSAVVAVLKATELGMVSAPIHFSDYMAHRLVNKHRTDVINEIESLHAAHPNTAFALAALAVPTDKNEQTILDSFRRIEHPRNARLTEHLAHSIIVWSQQARLRHIFEHAHADPRATEHDRKEFELLKLFVSYGVSDMHGAIRQLQKLERAERDESPSVRERFAEFLVHECDDEFAKSVRQHDEWHYVAERSARIEEMSVAQLPRQAGYEINANPFGSTFDNASGLAS